ncbi:MAG: restriction endonuclease subunit S [Ruminiclostridium sp.]|nr:restriction endonuclease subunit S [Ruminiclostridium sp.]
MSRIDELIVEHCPNGVEYVKLGDVCSVTKGRTPIQKAIPGEYPLVVTTSERKSCNTYQFDKPAVCIPLVSSRGHGVASLNHVYFQSGKFALGNILCAVIPNDENILSANFLYHYLEYKKDFLLVPLMKGGANVSLHIDDIQRVNIPLPPIEVQNKTIEILDKFIELSEALTKELLLRQNQYKYYRDRLLSLDVHKEAKYEQLWKTVGELFEIRNGLNKEKEAFGKGKPIINFTDVYKNRWLAKGSFSGLVDVSPVEIERYSAKKGDVFFTRTSETKEDIGMSSTLIEDVPDCVFSGFVLRARPKTNLLLPKFCAYYFSTHNVRKQIVKYASFTTRATTTGDKLSKIKIPVPPLEEQERIVSILDRFDKLCNDISEGLPAEIEARRKQYEYYRDKLLTFKEKTNA